MSNSEPIAWLSKVLKGSLAGTIGFANPASKLNHDLYEGPFPVFRRADPDIEAAAKTLAFCMDYPWEHMPEQGREAMRKHAAAVIEAALGK